MLAATHQRVFQIDKSPDVHAIPFQTGQKLGFANSLDRLVMSNFVIQSSSGDTPKRRRPINAIQSLNPRSNSRIESGAASAPERQKCFETQSHRVHRERSDDKTLCPLCLCVLKSLD